FVSLADFAQQILGRHPDLLQNQRRCRRSVQSELVLFLPVADARERTLDDEGGEVFAVYFREDDEEVREAAVGDPHLLAGQHEAAVWLPRRPRFRAERIRSRARLAERISA